MVRLKKDKVATERFVYRLINDFREEVDKRFDTLEKSFNEKFNKMMDRLDWLVGAYKRFDEEHTVLSHKASDHEDRIGKLERTIFKTS